MHAQLSTKGMALQCVAVESRTGRGVSGPHDRGSPSRVPIGPPPQNAQETTCSLSGPENSNCRRRKF